MKINSCLGFALLLLLLVSCALAAEETTTQAKGASDEVEPAYRGGGGCKGGNCGGSGGCKGGNCGGSGGCKGGSCGGGGGYHCNHGCCKYYGGQCKQCCHSAAEARVFAEEQAHP
ncbi:putative glycine rich protein [Helianthus annuus]|uniref:Glycine rich protein n=1 Tax=Helianthus annuus TaxID=4232 RepID=A0A9K3NTM4_HELAN|nr:eggshell protein isoform X2 [Helianthus annuus]KAF5812211.1 putative glycine rich protein [Helianthus annuus]KAJ0933333.1 putative glycine rich protein [Helianthus annuus]